MIGLFGGTFDPIHLGHLRPALEVMEGLALQEVRFIPGALPPHRDAPWLSAERRAEMVQCAIEGQPGFVLDRRELQRFEKGQHQPSYTVDTLASFRAEFGAAMPLFLLMGTDAFLGLESWHRWQELLVLCNIVVMSRPDYGLSEASTLFKAVESRLVRPEEVAAKAAGQVVIFPVTPLDISATDIRQRLENGHSVRYLMPDKLLENVMFLKERKKAGEGA